MLNSYMLSLRNRHQEAELLPDLRCQEPGSLLQLLILGPKPGMLVLDPTLRSRLSGATVLFPHVESVGSVGCLSRVSSDPGTSGRGAG